MSDDNTGHAGTANTPQHWLILSHCFNMDGRAASHTITDKLPYLLEQGIELQVISGVLGEHDQRFLHLQLLPWGPSGLRFDLRHVVARKFGRGFLYRLLGFLTLLLLGPLALFEQVLFGLQSHASWALTATLHALLLVRKQRPSVIYSTGGAYSAHLAGFWLKKLTGIRWIAEIHDPMVVSGSKESRNTRFLAKLEGRICRNADSVWWFTEGALESARRRHPELGDRGIVVLPGAEPLSTTVQYQRGPQMIIGHFGSLSNSRSLLPVVHAIGTLVKMQPELRPEIRVHVYGGHIDLGAAKAIAEQGLGDVFVCFGRLEKSPETGRSGREQVFDLMRQADCLLLVHGNIEDCREYIPSKLYEYFWAKRPIIALTHKNHQLGQMLAERNSYVAAYDQPDEVLSVFKRAYVDWQENRLLQSAIPAIGTKQAVDAILSTLSPY